MTTEKRREERYKGSLPLAVGSDEFNTLDFSVSGVFFEADKSFLPGQAIEFTIALANVDPGHPLHLKCRGEIVRIEEKGVKLGVAAAISSYTLEKVEDGK